LSRYAILAKDNYRVGTNEAITRSRAVSEQKTYVVFLFPQAVEALGEAIKPYICEGPAGAHLLCSEIDTGGAFCEMTVQGKSVTDKPLQVEVMVPVAMIRLIVSVQDGEHEFGFG
jgi:hypothetical protein